MDMYCSTMDLIYECNRDADKGENRIVNVHTTRFSYHELGLPHMPQRCSVVQAGKNILYPGPCVAVFQPAQFNCHPQFVAESKAFRPLRLHRSDSLHNLVDGKDIRLELEVRVVPA